MELSCIRPIFLFSCLVICTLISSSVLSYEQGKSKPYQRRQRTGSYKKHVASRCHYTAFSNEEGDSSLETKVRESDFVFTGKVTSEIQDPDSSGLQNDDPRVKVNETQRKSFLVRVKRVLKGDFGGGKEDGVGTLERLFSDEHKVVQIREAEKDGVPVSGYGCYRTVRVHHTAVFLAKKSVEAGGDLDEEEGGIVNLQLISEPVPLTLHNLDKVNALVKDIIYKPRTPIVEEPCEKTYCQFGADCVTRPDGSAHCECPTSCSTVFTPVCGTDGVTYSNHCLMRMRACQESENIRAQYSGECGAQPRPKGRRG